MKRAAAVMLVFVLVFLSGCRRLNEEQPPKKENAEFINGVWVSFSELDEMAAGDFKLEFSAAADRLKNIGTTDVFLHTIPFCDAIYKSEYYPLRKGFEGFDFDVLEYIISECHTRGMRLHAWINPYRVKTADSDLEALEKNSPAAAFLSDSAADNNDCVISFSGVYLNPAKPQVIALILNAVTEILNNYEVDGIHFDDYFYPTTDPAFDALAYENYRKNAAAPLGLADWRRENVNALVSGCYNRIKFLNSKVVFSISPAASIERNLSEYYADITAWLKGGYIDMLIPQLYFGFDYPDESYRFENLLNAWQKLTSGFNTRLVIGLAVYKIGTEQQPDRDEWADPQVLTKQIRVCKNSSRVSGYCLFSYSFIQNSRL